MQDILAMLDLVKSRTPWALARFGDADAVALLHTGPLPKVNVHDPEDVDVPLQQALMKWLSHKQENYWVGTCCPKCRPSQARQLRKHVRANVTTSNISQAASRPRWIEAFVESYPSVWFVAGQTHDISKMPFKEIRQIAVPPTNAWSAYERVRYRTDDFDPGDVVLLCSGRLGNVLTGEWFEKRPDCTFINVGTMFDDVTFGRVLPNHKNPHAKKCRVCNPFGER